MDRKLWIIGDSFTMIDTGRYGKNSWPELCINHFKGDNHYLSSVASRDIQTVFDIFLENLYRIKSDDFVILMLPTLTRFRLPLATPYVNVSKSNISRQFYNTNSMIGGTQYSAQMKEPNMPDKERFRLEFPLSEIDPMVFQPSENPKTPNVANIIQMINSSNAFINNWNSILKSIQSYVPFKLLYYSWENKLDTTIVNTKDVITKDLGIWETLQDVYCNTNGEKGDRTDGHWSEDMNIKFAEHIIKNYSQYFNDEFKIL